MKSLKRLLRFTRNDEFNTMSIANFTYFFLLIFSISYPLFKSSEKKIQMNKKWRIFAISIVSVAIPFIIWDVLFEHMGIWSFNPEYVTGIYILNLPLEEWLFFFFVPYACIFIYEVLNYFFKAVINKHFINVLLILFSIAMFTLAYIYKEKTYTFTITFIIGILALAQMLFISPQNNWKALRAFIVSLIPFLLVNGVLTWLPVVSYNDLENSGVRIFTIPIEDAGYLYILLALNFIIIEQLRKKIKFT